MPQQAKMKILMLVAIKSVYIRKGLDSLVSISDLVSTFSSIRFFYHHFTRLEKNMAWHVLQEPLSGEILFVWADALKKALLEKLQTTTVEKGYALFFKQK